VSGFLVSTSFDSAEREVFQLHFYLRRKGYRAYQVVKASAKPSDDMPAKVTRRSALSYEL